MEESPASYLRQAKALFEEGDMTGAEDLLRSAETRHPSDAGIRTFRAYLLYRTGKLEEAGEAYHRLADEFSEEPSHLSNLGLIYFKREKFVEAREAFERFLLLRPDDGKALRNLGLCFRKLGNETQAQEYLRRAQGEEEQHPASEERRGKEELTSARERYTPAVPGVAGVEEWIRGSVLPSQGRAGEILRRGPESALCFIDEKMYIKKRHLISYGGVVVFASSSHMAERAAVRFGDPEMELIRVEGTGEVGLGGGGWDLQFLHLEEGREFHVNYPFLVGHGPGIDVEYDFSGMIKGVFLEVRLSGTGAFVMMGNRDPLVLQVQDDAPAFVRAGCVLGWGGELTRLQEDGPAQAGFFTRRRGREYLLFEGQGYLVLHSGPMGKPL